MMKREMRVAFGAVPHSLDGAILEECRWQLLDGQFLLRAEGDRYFHYRRGDGVTVERGTNADAAEELLWLNGSVYAAVASLNGLLPVHASAVAVGSRVVGVAGPAGSGKSTLIAALGDRGFPMFCDDTLVLDLSDPERIFCLPGHKRLKLAPDAFALTEAERQEQVSPTIGKRFARSAAGEIGQPLPLAQLIFLDEAPDLSLIEINGAERFRVLNDEHYTARLFASARRFDRRRCFDHLVTLAQRISCWRFRRPRDFARFQEGLGLVAHHLETSVRNA